MDDPDVMEDVMFLIEDGCQFEEVARRCNVGYWALVKSGVKEKEEDEAQWLRRYRLWPG